MGAHGNCSFRSNTEELWAQFFDSQGIIWHYEPISFKSGGRRYTPDFQLGQENIFVETKWVGAPNTAMYLVNNGGPFTRPFTRCPLIYCDGRPGSGTKIQVYRPGEYVPVRFDSFMAAYAAALDMVKVAHP